MYPRLVVVEHIYHQRVNLQPQTIGKPYSRRLTSSEQPFLRQVIINSPWKSLGKYWKDWTEDFEDKTNLAPGFIYIRNESYIKEDTLITVELPRLELGFKPYIEDNDLTPQPIFSILPQEVHKGTPIDINVLYLRAINGPITAAISIFPS